MVHPQIVNVDRNFTPIDHPFPLVLRPNKQKVNPTTMKMVIGANGAFVRALIEPVEEAFVRCIQCSFQSQKSLARYGIVSRYNTKTWKALGHPLKRAFQKGQAIKKAVVELLIKVISQQLILIY